MTFEFTGASLAEFQQALHATTDEMLEAATDAAMELGQMGADEARRLAPERTGDLRASIRFRHIESTERFHIVAVWGTSKEYAGYVEFGTGPVGRDTPVPGKYPGEIHYAADWNRGMAARPYLYPSSQYVAKQLQEVLKRCIQRRMTDGGA